MKKIFSFFCYIAIAIAAVTFVSCGKDDDDDIITPIPEQEAKIPVYVAALGDGALELFDIKISIYRNGKKREVVLDKNTMTPIKPEKYENVNGYYCSSVNGEEGVDSVVAEVSIKPNVKDIIASKDPKSEGNFYASGLIKEVEKFASGNYSAYFDPGNNSIRWENVTNVSNGLAFYESRCKTVKDILTAKK